MQCHDHPPDTIDSELVLPIATVRLMRWRRPPVADHLLRAEGHLIDLCVTPRPPNARGGYHAQWGPHRLERLGDILIVPAGHALRVRGDGGGAQASIRCELHGDHLDTWLGTRIDWTDQRLHAALDIASITIRQLLRRLASEAATPGAGSRLLANFLVGQLVIELGRYCEAIGDVPASGGLSAWRLRLIDERLRGAGEPPDLAELAGLCRISVRQLTRGFRASRGTSIGDHLVHNRIETAKRLLGGGPTDQGGGGRDRLRVQLQLRACVPAHDGCIAHAVPPAHPEGAAGRWHPYRVRLRHRGSGRGWRMADVFVEAPGRVVPLSGARNFRDLGGYPAGGGRHVRWGQVYRSGSLAGLTPADWEALRARDIRAVCDLRTAGERAAAPFAWADAPGMIYRAGDHPVNFAVLSETLRAGFPSGEAARAGMIAGYRELPFQQAAAFRELFARLRAGDVPLVVNCAAGKDRAGTAAALILTALGVPRETVIGDYTLTNAVYDVEAMLREPREGHLARFDGGVRAAIARADPAYIAAALDAIDTRGGGIDAYLADHAGISATDLAIIRDLLLA